MSKNYEYDAKKSYGVSEFDGIFISKMCSLEKHPTINYIEAKTKLQLQLRYITEEEEKNSIPIMNLVQLNMVSGGLPCSVRYSIFLVGNICSVKILISEFCVLTLKMKVISMNLYEGSDTCFPYMCGTVHY